MIWFGLGLLLFTYLFYHLVLTAILLLLYWFTPYFERQQRRHQHQHLRQLRPLQNQQNFYHNRNQKSSMDFQVVRLCLFTRLGVTLLAVAANFLPDHESADAFRNDLLARYPVDQRSTLDRAILWWAEPLTRWDAQYFLEIAHENGYREEQTLAFFPMFPLLVRYVGLGLQRAILFHFPTAQLSFISSLMLAAYLVNLVAFTLTGWFLYQLTYTVSHSRAQSYRAVKIFAFNPASIFFTAYYTESLFSCLTFGSLYFLYHYNLSVVSSVLIALSAYTRSNGVVTFPFIAFSNLIHMLSMAKGARASPAYLSLRFFTVTALEALICLIPPVLFQWSAWVQFCRDTSSSSPKPVWCQGDTFSLPYSYVQGTYWENGFLRYYQLKKIPNFLMAAPTLLLVITSTLLYLRRHRHHLLALLVDHFSPSYNPQLSITALTEHSAYVVQHQPQPQQPQPQQPQQPQQQSQPPSKPQEYKRNDLFQQPCLLPFALHALFLATFCLLFMHVEVATRLLFSASPWPMWALVHVGTFNWLGSWSRGLVTAWLLGYCVLGTTLFANFLPFT